MVIGIRKKGKTVQVQKYMRPRLLDINKGKAIIREHTFGS
jgi:hypothetical protein